MQMRPRYGNLSACREVIAACLQTDWYTHTDVEVFRSSFLLLWKTLVDTFELRLLIEVHDEWPGAGALPEGGEGAGGRTPNSFCAKYFEKSPKLAKQILGASPRTPCAPSFFKSWIRPCGNLDLDDSSQVSMWTKTETWERRHAVASQLGGC